MKLTEWTLVVLCVLPSIPCAQVLEFESKPELTQEMWDQRQPKLQAFFGPGIVAALTPTDKASRFDGAGAACL